MQRNFQKCLMYQKAMHIKLFGAWILKLEKQVATVLLFSFAIKKVQYSCQLEKEWVLLILFVRLILFVMVNLVRSNLEKQLFSQTDILSRFAFLVLLCLIFYIIQSIRHWRNYSGRWFITEKANKLRHGVGLKNVQMVVDKYIMEIYFLPGQDTFGFLVPFSDYSAKNLPIITIWLEMEKLVV